MSKGRNRNDKVFRAECADICDVDVKTWDRIITNKMIVPDGTTPPKKKWFYRWKVEDLAKKIPKKKFRKPGIPLIIETSKGKN